MLVKVEVLGQPDPDYRVTDVRINPSVVKIIGSPSVLGDLSGFLTTVPISIAGRTEDVVERLPLELPPGVATVDPNEPAVQVTVEIEPFPGSLTVTRTVTFQGLQPGLMAQASPQVVEVLLSGPRPRLSTLLPEDVRVILDVSDLRLGDQDQLEPVVVQPEGITVDSVIPSVIQVEIVQMPSPTPESQEPGE
jgi:YbbR domain-containing protein